MNRSSRSSVRSTSSLIRGRTKIAAVAAALGIVVGFAATPSSATGAWFTAKQTRAGNAISSATLGPVQSFTATERSDGMSLRWGAAEQQTWATANGVTSGLIYTVTRSVNGQSPTTVYTGSSNSFRDAYPTSRVGLPRTTVSAGMLVTGAVQSDGSVWTWGTGERGSLGTNSSYTQYPTKVPIPAGHPIVDLKYASLTAAATSSDGTVWSWGPLSPNNCGGGYQNNATPIQIPTPPGKTIVSASPGVACQIIELASDGTLWGASPAGSPVAISLPNDRRVAQLTKSTMVLANDGTVWGWGDNSYGQLADGSTGGFVASDSPVRAVLPSGTYAKKVASSTSNSVFLLNDNTIWTVGANDHGQLGAGIAASSRVYGSVRRFQAPTSKTWVDVSASSTNIAALASDGTVYIAGRSADGQTGTGDTVGSETTPVPVRMPANVQFKTLETRDLPSSVYSLDQNNTLWGWGANKAGTAAVLFGNNDSASQYNAPTVVASNRKFAFPSTMSFCYSGGAPTESGYCEFGSNVEYSVFYAYRSWKSPLVSTAAG